MKKSLIIIGVLVVVTGALFLLIKVTEKNDEDYIDSYLSDDGFKFDEDGNFYKKVISDITMDEYFDNVANDKASEYEELYFYSGSYKLTKLKMKYSDEVSNVYTVDYNLINNTIAYKYEISIYSSSIILEGYYTFGEDENEDKFTCEVIDTRSMDDDGQDAYCSRAKYETLLFIEESNDILSNPRFSSIIDKGLKEVIEE